MKGRRLADVKFGELPSEDTQPGDYWKYLDRTTGEPMKPIEDCDSKSNLTNTGWGYYSPDGNGIGTLMIHTVREHEDRTISVIAGDGSSNSILHKGGSKDLVWHGYIDHGVWNKLPS